MIRRLLTLILFAAALPAAAQNVPATNYTDLWYNPLESGWGVAFTQHSAPSNQAYAMWYTYDPREPDPTSPGNYKPLWIVMSGGTWTSPTTITGPVYVLNGTPFFQSGTVRQPGNDPITMVGSFTIHFTDASHATFTYNISPPSGLAASDPAFGLPALNGTKTMERIQF
jgi:hypothetical protein